MPYGIRSESCQLDEQSPAAFWVQIPAAPAEKGKLSPQNSSIYHTAGPPTQQCGPPARRARWRFTKRNCSGGGGSSLVSGFLNSAHFDGERDIPVLALVNLCHECIGSIEQPERI